MKPWQTPTLTPRDVDERDVICAQQRLIDSLNDRLDTMQEELNEQEEWVRACMRANGNFGALVELLYDLTDFEFAGTTLDLEDRVRSLMKSRARLRQVDYEIRVREETVRRLKDALDEFLSRAESL